MALLATRKPAKRTQIPVASVIANDRSAPTRPDNAPLAERTAEPAAMRMLPAARRRAENTLRVADEVTVGEAPRRTRHADHAAPAKMSVAGTAEPTAARTRGRTPKCSFPVGIP